MSKRNKLMAGQDDYLQFQFQQALLISNVSDEQVAPKDMWIEGIDVIVDSAPTTGGTVTILTGPAGAVTVAGISAVVANAAAKGTIVSSEATKKSATRYVAKGQRIQIKPTGFATAGAIKGVIRYNESADTDSVLPF